MVSVVKGGATVAQFVYDGDGNRVQSTIGTVTTTFVGNYYETDGTDVTKYYYAGAQRIAMRVCPSGDCANTNPTYLLSDQLGSTSITADGNGGFISELRYKAWGEVRYADGTTPTQYQYTGQYSDSYINLLDYGSRRYDPELGRFIQPDSIVPDPSNPQAWNRYAYTLNNPIRFNDPSGHVSCQGSNLDDGPQCYNLDKTNYLKESMSRRYNWHFSGRGWSVGELTDLFQVGIKWSAAAGGDTNLMRQVGGTTFGRSLDPQAETSSSHGNITVANYTFAQTGLRHIIGPEIALAHELAHAWDQDTTPWARLTNEPGAIVSGLSAAIGNESAPTWYGTTDIREDWAETVTSYLYADYANILVAEGDPRENIGRQPGLETRPYHLNYVECQFGLGVLGGSCTP